MHIQTIGNGVKRNSGWMWWCTPLIPALGKQWHLYEIKVSLVNIASSRPAEATGRPCLEEEAGRPCLEEEEVEQEEGGGRGERGGGGGVGEEGKGEKEERRRRMRRRRRRR